MKKMLLLSFIVCLAVGLLVVVSCGSSATTATSPTTGNQVKPSPGSTPGPDYKPAAVDIKNFAFSPATITVAVGTTVTWTNNDAMKHTVTSKTGVFDSSLMSQGATFSYTFNTAGDFEYYCTLHPYMVGHVIVQ
jgi:plastocyanin